MSSSNGIDRIYLRNVKRRYLKDDRSDLENRYYQMPGEFFVIPFDKILNIHITYYKIDIEESEEIRAEIERENIN